LAFPEIWSEFVLVGERLEPPLVTRRLALTPSRAYRKGDPIVAGEGKRLTNGWILSIGPERSFALNEQIQRLIAQLEPKTAEIVRVRDEFGAEVRIYCAVYVADETPNISFNPDVVAWASRVGASISVDLYIGDEALLRPPLKGFEAPPN